MQLRRLATGHGVDVGALVLVVVVAGLYVHAVRTMAGSFGFPLDDSYIYLTYARQIGRGRPFSYFDGSGFTAGATSMLWPLVLAPLWVVGFRANALIPVVFVLCAALLVGTAMLAYRIGRRTLGKMGGACAGAFIVFCGPLAWAYLAGMEVALAGFLLLFSTLALLAHEPGSRPPTRLLVLLGATAIARPEMTLVVAPVVGGCALRSVWHRQFRDGLRWLAPLAAPLLVSLLDRAFAGHFVPNTAIAKSHMYMPGFNGDYWAETLRKQSKKLFLALFWEELPQTRWWSPRLVLALWLVGAGRLIAWAIRTRRHAGVALLVGSAPILLLTVLATSGLWTFQNYRYIAPAMAPLWAVCGLALAPPKRLARPASLGLAAAALGVAALVCTKNWPRVRDNARLYGQGVRDMNAQTVRIGRWIDSNLPPDARIALHDVGAVGYYAHRKLIDVIGLVTNHQAEICNQGPGARFEWLERLPASERPTHFVYYSGWLLAGSRDVYGKTLLEAKLLPPMAPPLAGGQRMEVMEANLSLLGSGEAPVDVPEGWQVVDTVDVADVVSEREHRYTADLGPRFFGVLSDNWSCYYSATQPIGDGSFRTIADGGRVIRGQAGETFVVRVDPKKPFRLLVRTGAPAEFPAAPLGRIAGVLSVERADTHVKIGEIKLPAPAASFEEPFVEIAADPTRPLELSLAVRPIGGRVRTFHYWVLQPK